jgi:hypothetical protein
MTPRTLGCQVVAVILAASCDSGRPPAAPTPTPIPAVQKTVTHISGWVADTAFRPLVGVRVEIVSGPATGTVVTNDAPGEISFSGEFSGLLTFRATKDGYLPATTQLNVQTLCDQCTPRFHVLMESIDPTLTFEPGSYTLTLIADPSCSRLPPEARTRSYEATLSHATGDYAGSYDVRVPAIGLREFHNSFLLGISGNYLATDDYAAPTLFERMSTNAYVEIDFLIGTTAFAKVENSGISVPFAGLFEFCSTRPGAAPNFCDRFAPDVLIEHEHCFAESHRLMLVRR